MENIRFGTDGWRAVIAEGFTFDNVARVADATARVWLKEPTAGRRKRVVVGFDRRFLSDRFARTTAEVMTARGFEVLMSPAPLPTPALSLAVVEHEAVGGVMLTASHNPPRFNGFKVKAHFGGSADPALCQRIEACLELEVPAGEAREDAIEIHDFTTAHLRRLKQLVDFKLVAGSGLRFAHEALFGVGAGCFDRLLKGTSCRVTTLNATHDPFFGGINPEPVPANYSRSSAFLRKHPHDLCLVTDGDADRVGGMTGRGGALTTHAIIALLLRHLSVHRGLQGRVVKALTTTSMIDKMCADAGLPLVETGVGFKYIAAEMLKGGVLLGAEESGGIGFPGHIPERDGILAGLMLLEMLAVERRPLEKLLAGLERKYGPHRYARLDTHFPVERRAELMEACRNHPPAKLLNSPVEKVQSFDGVKYTARDGSWLMVRGSGTEPVLRIYAEAATEAGAARMVETGKRMARRICFS
ncbi:MAG: phosphoglucomutase/phosphomannomutase family protein [Verrucomicrobia bacterium]|nr:phosphoglucomutase/phosphomannomutase family protein [Verrucomicrobiota bacterium]